MAGMFNLTHDQLYTASNWINNHDCPITDVGAIGGKITYTFTITSIGTAEGVQCACGAKKNLTDYDLW
jgi:hypothetical protein